MKLRILFACLGLVGFLPGQESAVPQEISYQAFLRDGQGQPLGNSGAIIYEVTMRIWDAPTGGNLLWSERQSVSVFQGRLSMTLGTGAPVVGSEGLEPRPPLPSVFGGNGHYAELTFQDLGDPQSVPATLNQRQRLVGVPTAFRASLAESLRVGYLLQAVELKEGVLTSEQLAPGAVTTGKLALNTIGSAQIALEAVTADQLVDGVVTGAGVKDGDLQSSVVSAGSLATSDFFPGAVTSAKIADGSIQGQDFAPGSMTADAVANGGLTAADLAQPAGIVLFQNTAEMGITVGGNFGSGRRTLIFDPVALNFPTSGIQGARLRVGGDVSRTGQSGYLIVFPGADGQIPEDLIHPALANSVMVQERLFEGDLIDENGDSAEREGNLLPHMSTVYCPLTLRPDGRYEAEVMTADFETSSNGNWGSASGQVSFQISVIGSY